MIGSADQLVQEREEKFDGRFCYHKRLLLSVAMLFKSDARPSSFDDAVVVTREALGDEHPKSSLGAVVVSVPMITGDDEDDWDFGHMPSCSTSGREQRLGVLYNI